MTRVREYRSADATALSALYRRAVESLGPRRYTAEQCRAWAALAPTPERLEALLADGRTRLVAVDADDRPLAFADLERDGHIDLLYCAPEAAGRGVATALCDALEGYARGQEMSRLYAEASELARGFLARRGFVVGARRELDLDGVAIHNYAVAKRLTPP